MFFTFHALKRPTTRAIVCFDNMLLSYTANVLAMSFLDIKLQLDHNQMAFVIVVVLINIQLIIDESLLYTGLSHLNQRSVYESEYVRIVAICY